ncbi:1,2-phenylacetyl-CoA epoxidase subunit PaaC [Actinoalloteichus spitiensis]|uniref:1,2-phenylacetyl-CoA epoxidase subunit PaaC n=1 Tax=Actinoalloteichus spitiensis TaxID=252394 RepID=UPI0003803E91|nr:1,2-phenylacetyl-CoA epoxidase subunit PaaC [Actinoalloteichus spitiensis]
MAVDNAYEALTEDSRDLGDRWAYGTGFQDPLSGVDATLPTGADLPAAARHVLGLGDDALVMAHRLSEWCTHAPELEEEVALANIALDLLGQARLLLARAAQLDPGLRPAGVAGHVPDEDALAFFRSAEEYRNVRLVEVPHGDFGHLVARLLVFSTWRLGVVDRLTGSRDPVVAAVAAKAVPEIAYHRDHAAGWTLRLGDGTDESHRRMARGLAEVWPLVGELFTTADAERPAIADGVGVDPATTRAEFEDVLRRVRGQATLGPPGADLRRDGDAPATAWGRTGRHTAALRDLLAEMQSVARAHPEGRW